MCWKRPAVRSWSITATLVLTLSMFRRLSVLEEASREELEEHNDVCSICYQDMAAAKKTICGHFFHAACLK